jgi:hypothetical protein
MMSLSIGLTIFRRLPDNRILEVAYSFLLWEIIQFDLRKTLRKLENMEASS